MIFLSIKILTFFDNFGGFFFYSSVPCCLNFDFFTYYGRGAREEQNCIFLSFYHIWLQRYEDFNMFVTFFAKTFLTSQSSKFRLFPKMANPRQIPKSFRKKSKKPLWGRMFVKQVRDIYPTHFEGVVSFPATYWVER